MILLNVVMWFVVCNLCLECLNKDYESVKEWDKYTYGKKSLVFLFVPFLYLLLVTVKSFKK